MTRAKKTTKAKKPETPEAIAARVADKYFDSIVFDVGAYQGDLPDGIIEVYEAFQPGGDETRNRMLGERANYIVGVQVGLRLRNVGGVR